MTPRPLKLQVLDAVADVLESSMESLKGSYFPSPTNIKVMSTGVARFIRPIKMVVSNHIRFNHEFN